MTAHVQMSHIWLRILALFKNYLELCLIFVNLSIILWERYSRSQLNALTHIVILRKTLLIRFSPVIRWNICRTHHCLRLSKFFCDSENKKFIENFDNNVFLIFKSQNVSSHVSNSNADVRWVRSQKCPKDISIPFCMVADLLLQQIRYFI